MRKRISVAVLAAAIIAGTLLGAIPSAGKISGPIFTPEPPRCEVTYMASDFRPFADEVWDLARWRRDPPAPKKSVRRSMRLMKSCAAGLGHLVAMRKRWKKDKLAFYAHRREKIKEREARDARLSVIDSVGMGTLEAIAACESGGDPTAVSPGGTYRGKYQFDYGTWESVGGSGDPAAAPESEQDYRAALLYLYRGSSPWPVCGV